MALTFIKCVALMLGRILFYNRICVLLQIHQALGGHSKREGLYNCSTDCLDSYIVAGTILSFFLQILYNTTFLTLLFLLIAWKSCWHESSDSVGLRLQFWGFNSNKNPDDADAVCPQTTFCVESNWSIELAHKELY